MRHELVVGLGHALRHTLLFLPEARRIHIERWLRGWEEARLLDRADVACVSYAKSGRTWLRTMLSRAYQEAYGIPAGTALEFDNLHRLEPRIPAVLFTHGNYLRDYRNEWADRASFHDKRVLLLVRDPRDTAVSQYFQWRHRMHAAKKPLNFYPPHGADRSVAEFVLDEPTGLKGVLDFLEIWQRELPRLAAVHVVHYERLRRATAPVLTGILEFLGTPAPPEAVGRAVAYASVENMRKLEAEGSNAGFKGQRLRPGDAGNPESFKVRRGKVGGWRDYLSDAEIAAAEAMIAARPGPLFGYERPADQPDATSSIEDENAVTSLLSRADARQDQTKR